MRSVGIKNLIHRKASSESNFFRWWSRKSQIVVRPTLSSTPVELWILRSVHYAGPGLDFSQSRRCLDERRAKEMYECIFLGAFGDIDHMVLRMLNRAIAIVYLKFHFFFFLLIKYGDWFNKFNLKGLVHSKNLKIAQIVEGLISVNWIRHSIGRILVLRLGSLLLMNELFYVFFVTFT